MTISNYLNQYFKLQSPEISNLIQNLGDYSSLEIKGYINCCTCPDEYKQELIIDEGINSWSINLSKGVTNSDIISQLNIQSVFNGATYNTLGLNIIDLGYVNTHCGVPPCTLEDFSSYYTPLIKDLIDTSFGTKGISSNIGIALDGNNLTISDIPEGFILSTIVYGSNDINTTYLFSYSSTPNSNIILLNDGIYVSPSLFLQDTMKDGVYKFTIKLDKNEVITEISNCSFIDVTIKCKVATLLSNIIKENEGSSEKISTIAHILHYSLVNASNCGCNCEELCKIYEELYKLVYNIEPQIPENCGC